MQLEPLYRAVYDNPAADAPRQVLADALLEVDDPRGELITLQIAAARGLGTPRTRERIEELLTAHWRAWLAELPGVRREGLDFHRGFLRACRYVPDGRSDGATWGTVETLRIHRAAPDARELGSPRLGWLERLHGADPVALKALVAGAPRPRLREVEVLGPWQESTTDAARVTSERETVLALARFATLETLRLVPTPFRFHADHLGWLWQSPLARQLQAVRLAVELPVDVGGTQRWLEREGLSKLRVHLEHRGVRFVLERGSLRLEFASARELTELSSRIRPHIRQFAPDPFREFSMSVGGAPASAADLARLGADATRYGRPG